MKESKKKLFFFSIDSKERMSQLHAHFNTILLKQMVHIPHIIYIYTYTHASKMRRLFAFCINKYFNFHPLVVYARSQCTPVKQAKWCANSEQRTSN